MSNPGSSKLCSIKQIELLTENSAKAKKHKYHLNR